MNVDFVDDRFVTILVGISVYDSTLDFADRSLHAETPVAGAARQALERLCRYVARPPLAAGSLTQISDELLSFKLKTPWSNGTTHILLSPIELIEKLAALVPRPRQNGVRYFGVFAPNAKDRDKIVPAGMLKEKETNVDDETPVPKKYRLTWAALLKRVFNLNLERCDHCGGKMRVVAAVTDPSSISRYLEGTGKNSEIPELAPARAPPQTEFDY